MTFWKINKKNPVFWGSIVLFFIIVVGVPCGLNIWVINNDVYSKSSADGWASFFGSFLGGVIGGVATLIAVLATISHNREELNRQDEKERNEKIRKSATIVYYDFKFAFQNILDFMNDFSKQANLKGSIAKQIYVTTHKAVFNRCMSHFDQFYFDTDWIKTVAELAVCEDETLVIEKIYEIYGNLLTIKKMIGNTDNKVRYEALIKMEEIGTKDFEMQDAEYGLVDSIRCLMERLKEKGSYNSEMR